MKRSFFPALFRPAVSNLVLVIWNLFVSCILEFPSS